MTWPVAERKSLQHCMACILAFLLPTTNNSRYNLVDQMQGNVIVGIEWFSFECRKTKTKVITLANHIGHRQYIEPIKTRSNYMWLTQSAGKSCERVTIGFGFTSDWMKRWRESFKPIASCRKCKTNYFSTLKWKPLYRRWPCFPMAILGDPGAVSRVGGNGTARNTDCPWISKDNLLNKF